MTKSQKLIISSSGLLLLALFLVFLGSRSQDVAIKLDSQAETVEETPREDNLMSAVLTQKYHSAHGSESGFEIFADYRILDQTPESTYIWALIQSFYVKDNRLTVDMSAFLPYRIDFDQNGEIIGVLAATDVEEYEASVGALLSEKAASAVSGLNLDEWRNEQDQRVDQTYSYLGDVSRFDADGQLLEKR